jgi:hypothetical protein
MKFLLCLGVLCALAVQPAAAQVARYYNLFNLSDTATNDLTATLPAGTTNKIVLLSGTVTNQWGSPSSAITITASNIVVRCQDFDKCGFTYQSVGVAGSTNGVFGVQIFGSTSKGAVWDTAPRWNFTTTNAAPNGATTFTIVTNLDLSGIDRLAFVFLNGTSAPDTNAWTGYQTNVIAGIRLKATKVLTLTESD